MLHPVSVSDTHLDGSNPSNKDLRVSSPTPEEILCSMFKVNSTLMDVSDPFRKDLRDSSPINARRNSVLQERKILIKMYSNPFS